MKKHFLFLTVAAIALSACSTLRDYTAPETPTGVSQTDLTRENLKRYKSAQTPVAAWWTEFKDPQLTALIHASLKTNLDVRIALANLAEARAMSKSATYDRFPTVTADSSYTRTLNSRETPSGRSLDRHQNNYDAGINASWELDLFGRVSQRIAAQEAFKEESQADLENIYVSVTADVARTYLSLRGAQYRLNIAERNAKNQQETYDLTQRLANGGRATELDVLRARTQLDMTRSTIPPLKTEITANIHRLSVLTGQIPETLEADLQTLSPLPSLPVTVAVGNAETLLKRRPDIRAAERNLAAHIAQYNVATTNLFPTVQLLGSLGFLATNVTTFGTNALAGSIGPSLSWRAFDLGRVHAEIDQADARSQAALAAYEKTVLEALEETQTALSTFSHEEQRRATLQQAAASAKRSARLARQRFDQGVDGFIDVLDAERTLLDAEDTLALSETSSALDLIAIYKALGGGWQVIQ